MNSAGETRRLESLREYEILDSEPEVAYDDLTQLVADICGVPIAMVTIIDEKRQWTKSKVGVDLVELDREFSFCNHTIQQRELLIVPDTLEDRRFADNPFVKGDPSVRFYAGYPIVSREGEGLGSVCVVDVQPKELTELQKRALTAAGNQVMMLLELRRRLREHKETNRALLASEGRFRDFSHNVDEVLWTVDAKTRDIIFVSPAYEQVWGRTVESLYDDPNSFLEAVVPHDRERVQEGLATQILGRYDDTYQIARPDGSLRWIHARAFPHLDEFGKVSQISGLCSDITAQKEAENERDRFFHSSVDLLTIHKLGETTYRQVNDSWQRTLGYTAEELCRGSFVDFIHPDDIEPSRLILGSLAHGVDVHHFTNRYRHKDGSWRWLEWQAFAPAPGEEFVYGTARDVTAQVEATEKLRLKTKELERVFHVFPDQFFQLDPKGVIVDHRGGSIEGLFPSECLGRSFHDILPPEIAERLKKAKQEARTTHTPQQIEFSIAGAQGERSFEVRILSEEEAEMIVVIRDITDRAMADRAQLMAKESAESASRSKSEFLASMSHELRTPLNAILNISESLGEGVYGAMNAKQQHSVQTVAESGRHLLGLINDILDLSKIEAGKLELSVAEVSVRPLCETSMRMVKELAIRKSQEMTLMTAPNVGMILADERKLKQILVNLLGNAVKFTPDGGRLGLEVEIVGADAAFTVWDSGIGIAPEDMEKLFQPFVQLDSKLSREYAGTGLGLSLAQRLALLHKGRIDVISKPGEGSRFTVLIPTGRGQKGAIPRAKTQRLSVVVRPESGEGLKVLLVEDMAANRECIGDYLTAKGFVMRFATNGAEAITMAFAEPPDIILTDIQMSGMDGFEAIRTLRQNPKLMKTPIVALTALAMDGDIERCMAAGASAYMSKPVALRELVSNLLAISRNAGGPMKEIISSWPAAPPPRR